MGRSSASFKRTNPRFRAQPAVLIICEDSKSAKNYLQDASRHFRVDVQVKVSHCGKTDPKGIVKEAIFQQAKFENVFCVIDRDTHPGFDEAILLAKANPKVTIIASFPCFEFWYILHFGMSSKPYMVSGANSAADMLIKDLCALAGMENYSKGDRSSVFDRLLGQPFAHARKISPQRLADALACKNLNPSTTVHELIDFLEGLTSPQPRAEENR